MAIVTLNQREKITPHILLIFTIFLRENLQDNGNMSNFAHEFLKLLSYKDIKYERNYFLRIILTHKNK